MTRSAAQKHTRQAGAFLAIGGLAFLVDAAVFNLLAFWVTGHGPFYDQPVVAKTIAIVVASLVTYVGNRYWTFNDRHLPHRWSRYALFVVFNLVAIGLQLGCLAFSRYVLHLEGPIPDNIAGTLIGQTLATLFRYLTYDRFVFPHEEPAAGQDEGAPVTSAP
ncbi:GtrA family protein [Microbacterium paludicola]|uniref:GtrA family protein n=1 Tax=Microbacterium paludicola TaxID=300019 RepID=A0A4Y9FS42_9MICO|nr:GtrA family protein [Microbacterium paludicola]MBF0817248.1 GtrA family protein [Microbacterium paludicola]TFU32047.1 GtrA family protein [Microbacterium paludicola]